MSVIDEEQYLSSAVMIGGQMVPGTVANVKLASPASSTYQFTLPYTTVYKGQHLSYRKGQTVSLDATLKAVLLAASAPMVAV